MAVFPFPYSTFGDPVQPALQGGGLKLHLLEGGVSTRIIRILLQGDFPFSFISSFVESFSIEKISPLKDGRIIAYLCVCGHDPTESKIL